jgi:hypothetical protein
MNTVKIAATLLPLRVLKRLLSLLLAAAMILMSPLVYRDDANRSVFAADEAGTQYVLNVIGPQSNYLAENTPGFVTYTIASSNLWTITDQELTADEENTQGLRRGTGENRDIRCFWGQLTIGEDGTGFLKIETGGASAGTYSLMITPGSYEPEGVEVFSNEFTLTVGDAEPPLPPTQYTLTVIAPQSNPLAENTPGFVTYAVTSTNLPAITDQLLTANDENLQGLRRGTGETRDISCFRGWLTIGEDGTGFLKIETGGANAGVYNLMITPGSYGPNDIEVFSNEFTLTVGNAGPYTLTVIAPQSNPLTENTSGFVTYAVTSSNLPAITAQELTADEYNLQGLRRGNGETRDISCFRGWLTIGEDGTGFLKIETGGANAGVYNLIITPGFFGPNDIEVFSNEFTLTVDARTGGRNSSNSPRPVTVPDEPLQAPAGGTSTIVETVSVETAPTVSANTGVASTKVDAKTAAASVAAAVKAVEKAVAGGARDAVAEVKIIAVSNADGAGEAVPVRTAEVEIPADIVKTAANAKNLVLTVENDLSVLSFDGAALAAFAEAAKDGGALKITMALVDAAAALTDSQREKIGAAAVAELSIAVGGTAIGNTSGTVKVSMPYTPPAELSADDYDLLTVYSLGNDGIVEIKAGYDAESGRVDFTAEGGLKFFVSEWISPFDDIARDNWYYKAVRSACSDGIITGTSENNFSPEADLSRAMLITILARRAGADLSGGTEIWYSAATEWGIANGITDGTDMEAAVTREQLATMLYRYASFEGRDTANGAALSAYADAGAVSDWAAPALGWATGEGLLRGREANAIVPGGSATRAETVTVMSRLR